MNIHAQNDHPNEVLPAPSSISQSLSKLVKTLPSTGYGLEWTNNHLINDIVPGLNRSSQSPNYYGFVIGGSTPAATFADNLVTQYDQNVAGHLPRETVASNVEDAALRMVCDLVGFREDQWLHRTFTTGATASNVLGLACGRDFVVQERAKRQEKAVSVAQEGMYQALSAVDLDTVDILTTTPHSSLGKAASIVGLGRSCVRDVGRQDEPHRFDLTLLESLMNQPRKAFIVVISCAEVNTGFFATSLEDVQAIHQLCQLHGAWLHVDAAFGLFARVLPRDRADYRELVSGVDGLELADSITSDAHKVLNVPYDCGIFFSRHLQIGQQVFQNSNAAYLNSGTDACSLKERAICSPFNIGIENSRRFRALPVYATLAAYGQNGYREMLERQVGLSREVARFIDQVSGFDLLPGSPSVVDTEERLKRIYIIVLFRAKDDNINKELVTRINASRKIYVSGTQWDGKPAARFAVSNWQVDVQRDLALIKEILMDVLK